jgi:hypothetical protein
MNLTENSFTSLKAPDTYMIEQTCCGDYVVKKNGIALTKTDKIGNEFLRYFKTRNSARKRISRERRCSFHR